MANKINARSSLVDYESSKIKNVTPSTTVAELHAFMRCFGTCQFLRGLWMDLSGNIAELHMRTDANNLVTTASTTRLPEQRETIHMINQLRHEACTGAIEDLAHVVSTDMMSDCLTKKDVKPDALIKAVANGELPNVDKHPPFRELMKNRHKAFMIDYLPLAEWCTRSLTAENVEDVQTFIGIPLGPEIRHCLAIRDWYSYEF